MQAPFQLCLTLDSEEDTVLLAQALAGLLRAGDVLALAGDLGTGKTTLARAFIRALTANPDEEVPSPTFTLVQIYETLQGAVWHFDLYRLSTPDEVLELGWEDALGEGIVLVEWPDRLGSLAPAATLTLTLTAIPGQPDRRQAALHGASAVWQERLRDVPERCPRLCHREPEPGTLQAGTVQETGKR